MVTPFLGEIVIYPYDEKQVPAGWLPCAGQVLQISQNQALFTLIGATFGGDGKVSFCLPDLRSVAPPQAQYYIATKGIFPKPPTQP